MIKVMTHGTFDILHYGHIEYLRKAKSYGEYLIVLLSTDEHCKAHGKKPYYNYDQRKKFLEAIRYVDLVIEQKGINRNSLIKEYNVNVFVETEEKRNQSGVDEKLCQVVYLDRTPEISSTKIKTEVYLPKKG